MPGISPTPPLFPIGGFSLDLMVWTFPCHEVGL